MRIIYRGGYNKRDEASVKQSMLYEYAATTCEQVKKGKNVVIVTWAKPDGFYDEMLKESGLEGVDVIGQANADKVSWSEYDLIFFPGGSYEFTDQLKNNGFDFDVLKDDVVIVGDSVGAYAMSAYYAYIDDLDPEKEIREISQGIYKKSKLVTIAHANNPMYTSGKDIDMIENFAKEHDLVPLILKENEAVLLNEENELISDFNFTDLFEA